MIKTDKDAALTDLLSVMTQKGWDTPWKEGHWATLWFPQGPWEAVEFLFNRLLAALDLITLDLIPETEHLAYLVAWILKRCTPHREDILFLLMPAWRAHPLHRMHALWQLADGLLRKTGRYTSSSRFYIDRLRLGQGLWRLVKVWEKDSGPPPWLATQDDIWDLCQNLHQKM
jgi:hypothetical protein